MKPIPLKPGLDYPDTYRSFVEMFPDDAACSAYLAKLRWPEGFVCPACRIFLPLGKQAVAASLASFAAIKHQSLQGRSLIRHGHH